MPDLERLIKIARAFGANDLGLQALAHIHNQPPARKPGGGAGNVCGRFPSEKMGVGVEYESYTGEAALVYEYEHDDRVFAYYPQPWKRLKVRYKTKNKKGLEQNVGPIITLDFFVVETDFCGWVEYKSLETMLRLAEEQPTRYVKDEHGHWRSPPAEAAAAAFGFGFQIRTSDSIDWVVLSNVNLLRDYFLESCPLPHQDQITAVKTAMGDANWVTLDTLLTSGNIYADTVYTLIAKGQLFADLSIARIEDAENFLIFASSTAMKAHMALLATVKPDGPGARVRPVTLVPGIRLQWDGNDFTVVNVGETTVHLIGATNAIIPVPKSEVESLIHQGVIAECHASSELKDELFETLLTASSDILDEMHARFRFVHGCASAKDWRKYHPCARTIATWKSKFRLTEQLAGAGLVGLLPNYKGRGNRTDRWLPEERRLINEALDAVKTHNGNRYVAWTKLDEEAKKLGVDRPVYKAFCKMYRARGAYRNAVELVGRKGAYKYKEWVWSLEFTSPRHGSRPFEICHIDHTEVDLEMVDETGATNLGKAWLTVMIDAYTRRILAWVLDYDEPSYRKCMSVLRDCVRRHGRLPAILVVDNGSEFHSTYFELLAAYLRIEIRRRPPSESKFGSVCERIFNTTNTQFFHNLIANTKIMKTPRITSKDMQPKAHALWNLRALNLVFEEYATQTYDTLFHTGINGKPREIEAHGFARMGYRAHTLRPYDAAFKFLTLPTTEKGTALVQPGRGIKVNHIYYWCAEFRNGKIERTSVYVRYDPFDLGIAYAWVEGKWRECRSEYFTIFAGRTEKQLQLITAEMRRLNKEGKRAVEINAPNIAKFITKYRAVEFMLQQEQRDREALAARANEVIRKAQAAAAAGAPATDSNSQGAPQEAPSGLPPPEERHRAARTAFEEEVEVGAFEPMEDL